MPMTQKSQCLHSPAFPSKGVERPRLKPTCCQQPGQLEVAVGGVGEALLTASSASGGSPANKTPVSNLADSSFRTPCKRLYSPALFHRPPTLPFTSPHPLVV